MVKLDVRCGKSHNIKYGNLSLNILFVVESKKIKNELNTLSKKYNFKYSNIQIKNILSDDNNEIRLQCNSEGPDEIIIHKVKLDNKFSVDYFRNYTAGLTAKIKKEKLNELHIQLPDYSLFKDYFTDEKYFYQTFVEGIYLGNYNFDKYLLKKNKPKNLKINFHSDNIIVLRKAISTTKIIIDGVNFTKDLQNEPANTLTPTNFAKRISSKFKGTKIKVSVMNEKEIAKRKMGGLLAVGMGSENPPRFIVMRYNGITNKNKKNNTIAIVGKGITFDSGGISIKPASGMGEMKADMSGAGVVAGIMLAAEKAKLPVNLIGIIASAENMVSGSAMRPGDIVVTASGKSIEVDNTDAEGRMVLADALYYASKEKPKMIIDLATLTGACVVALGELAAGIFSKNDKLCDELYLSGQKTYDRVWRLPLWDDYNILNKSNVADVKNVGGRWGGAITAAKFLENFVDEKIPWVHIDIAGPAVANKFNNYTKKFMTGFGVRLLFDFLSKQK